MMAMSQQQHLSSDHRVFGRPSPTRSPHSTESSPIPTNPSLSLDSPTDLVDSLSTGDASRPTYGVLLALIGGISTGEEKLQEAREDVGKL